FTFINRHLKNDRRPAKDADDKPLAGKELRVFPEDADLPKDSINDRIDETFIRTAAVTLPEGKEFPEWKTTQIRKLREKSFRPFPERVPRAVARGAAMTTKGGLTGHA